MTDPVETVLEARDGRQTSIGFDDAFVTIGKRINPTNRKVLTQQLKGGDMILARRGGGIVTRCLAISDPRTSHSRSRDRLA